MALLKTAPAVNRRDVSRRPVPCTDPQSQHRAALVAVADYLSQGETVGDGVRLITQIFEWLFSAVSTSNFAMKAVCFSICRDLNELKRSLLNICDSLYHCVYFERRYLRPA